MYPYCFRFGVSLKKREPSTESCNSTRENKEEGKEKSPQRTSLSLTSPSQDDGKSPVSLDSDVPAVGSPLEQLPPPPAFPENGKWKSVVFFYLNVNSNFVPIN